MLNSNLEPTLMFDNKSVHYKRWSCNKVNLPLFLFLQGNALGKSKELTILFTSLTLSLTFSWWAVRWAVTNRKDVPNIIKELATAPLVRNALPGRTDRLASSGIEIYHIKSRRMKIQRCKVPIRRNYQLNNLGKYLNIT